MKTILLSLSCLLLSLSVFAQKSPKEVKFQGSSFPVGAYWSVVSNSGDDLHLKMKDEETHFRVHFIGTEFDSDKLTEATLRFLMGAGVKDFEAIQNAETREVSIGKKKNAKGMIFRWREDRGEAKVEYHQYLVKMQGKKGDKYFIFLFEETLPANGASRFFLHRQTFEQETKLK